MVLWLWVETEDQETVSSNPGTAAYYLYGSFSPCFKTYLGGNCDFPKIRNRKRFDLILKSVKMQKQEWAIFKQIILLNCLLRLNWPIFVVSA